MEKRSTHINPQLNTYNMRAWSLQLCPTLWDPMDRSLPGSSVHGSLQGKNTGVGCHALLQGIFLTQVLNPWYLLHLLPHRQILYCWASRKAQYIQHTHTHTYNLVFTSEHVCVCIPTTVRLAEFHDARKRVASGMCANTTSCSSKRPDLSGIR